MPRHRLTLNPARPFQQASQAEWKCATVLTKLLALAMLCFLALGLVPDAQPSPVHDYIFSVTGVVKTDEDAPLQDAEIILEVSGPVYEAITLVKNVKRLTDSTGGFVFNYISHKRGVNTREFFRRGIWQRHPANIAVALHRMARINFHTPTAADHRYPPVLRENDKIFPEIHISEQFDDHVHAAP